MREEDLSMNWHSNASGDDLNAGTPNLEKIARLLVAGTLQAIVNGES